MTSWLRIFLALGFLAGIAYGYGFEYIYDPGSQNGHFWTHVPGSVPITHWSGIDSNNWNRGNWNRGNWNPNTWDAANPNRGNWNRGGYWNNPNDYRSDPNDRRYWDAGSREFKYTCKTHATYSDEFKRCIWNTNAPISAFTQ